MAALGLIGGAQADNEAVDLLAGADGLAEVYPEAKYIVVQHLPAARHVTGMTGNDVAMPNGILRGLGMSSPFLTVV